MGKRRMARPGKTHRVAVSVAVRPMEGGALAVVRDLDLPGRNAQSFPVDSSAIGMDLGERRMQAKLGTSWLVLKFKRGRDLRQVERWARYNGMRPFASMEEMVLRVRMNAEKIPVWILAMVDGWSAGSASPSSSGTGGFCRKPALKKSARPKYVEKPALGR